MAVFGGDATDPESAVLLVRGALAADDRAKAAELAEAAEKLVADSPGAGDMAAAGAHVRGLVEFQRLTGCRPGEACARARLPGAAAAG